MLHFFEPGEVYLTAGIVKEANNVQLNLFDTGRQVQEPGKTTGRSCVHSDRPANNIQWYNSSELPASVGNIKTETGLIPTGSFKSTISRVRTAADAASFFAPLAKKAKENVMMLVLDKNGKPLALVDVSTGILNQSYLVPRNTVGVAMNMPRASSVWLAQTVMSDQSG